jgi:hypothetical protein
VPALSPLKNPLRRRLVLGLIAAATAVTGAPNAYAGDYHVYSCRTPDNAKAVGTTGWSFSSNLPFSVAGDSCSVGGALLLASGSPSRAVGETLTATMTLPPSLSAVAISGARTLTLNPTSAGSDQAASPYYALYRDGEWYDAAHVLENCAQFETCNGLGNASGSFNFTIPGGTQFLRWMVGCGGSAGGSCGATASGTGDRERLEVKRTDVTLRDPAAPAVTGVGGMLAESGAHYGTESATFTADDAGAGVYQWIASWDGVEVDRRVVDANSGLCADVNAVPGDVLEFTQPQPCLNHAIVQVPVDTTKVADGEHHLQIDVRDAAGNRTTAFDKRITVKNAPSAAGATPDPAPGAGGPAATPAVTLSGGTQLVLDREQKSVEVKYGAKIVITGKLLDAQNLPIPGAKVEVFEQLAVTAAPWLPVATSVVTDSQGGYVYRPKTTASRRVRFAYNAQRDGAAYRATREVFVAVRAAMSARAVKRVVGPRGTIRIKGRVTVDELPKTGTWVEIQVLDSGTWRTISTRRTTKSGLWSFSHKVRQSRNVSFKFRSRLRASGEVASAESTSRVVKVRVS